MAKRDGVRFLNPKFKRALIIENPDSTLDQYLAEQGIEADRMPESMTKDRRAVIRRLEDGQHDLLFKRSMFLVDDEVLRASESLAAVMLCCIGDDSVDKEACAREGVLVMNDPISNGRSVVEMVFGQMICLARRIFDANDQSHHNVWTKDNKQRFELKGKVLGVLGLGNIGKQVAQMGEAFGMEIAFWDDRELAREVGTALGWRCCPTMLELFRQSDVISVHVSAENARGQSNRELLKYDHFAALAEARPSPSPRIFLNAARGFLYDPEHLKQALGEGKVLSAAVDVFPIEPGGKHDAWENPYAAFPQVVTTPHIGAATLEAQPRIGAYVAGTTRLFDEQGKVRSCVYSPGQTIGVDAERPSSILTVVHSDKRGTKKAISDSIFSAGLNNLESSHRDFSKFGMAYDVSAMDRPLTEEQVQELIEAARRISGDPTAIRAIRQIALGPVGQLK